MPKIQDARILMICTDGVEQLELTTPRDELRKQGARVEVATGREIRPWKFTDWSERQPAYLKMADANPDDYDALVIPGGVINLTSCGSTPRPCASSRPSSTATSSSPPSVTDRGSWCRPTPSTAFA